MNALFAVSPSGMIVRYDPSIVANPGSIFEKMSRRDFKTLKGFHSVILYRGANLSEPFKTNWNTTITNDSICTWGYLPKLIFNTVFEIMEFSGEIRLVPNFSRPSSYIDDASMIKGSMFWDPEKATNNQGNVHIKILFASNVVRTGSETQAVTNYLIFQLFDKTTNELIGNFLPPIPNVFNDGKICMGHAFPLTCNSTSETVGKLVQSSIDSFYSSIANTDLITDSMDRRQISSQLFGWDSLKETAPLMGRIERLLNVKVGNFLLDNLPYEN
jgi:hypothetical protein